MGAVEPCHVGEIASLGQDQFDHAAGRAFLEGAKAVDEFAQEVFARALEAVDHVRRLGQGPAHRFGDDRLEELFLVLEVEVGGSPC